MSGDAANAADETGRTLLPDKATAARDAAVAVAAQRHGAVVRA